MIKRYNQFVKENKTNEEYEYYYTDVDTPSLPALGERPEGTPSEAPIMDEMPEEMTGEVEEVGVDKYTDALQKLADATGVEFDASNKVVVIDGKKITFPTETEKYHVEGVKKPFDTMEEVLAYFENGVSPQARQEVRDEMSSISDEEALDRQEQFESKSYKSKRFKK